MKKESLIQALSLLFLISFGAPSCENSCNAKAPDPTGEWHCVGKNITLTIKKDGYNSYSINRHFPGGSNWFAGEYDDGAIKGSGGCSVGFLVNDNGNDRIFLDGDKFSRVK